MNESFGWFLSLVRVTGASFPVAASFVQLHAEYDRAIVEQRLRALEDPVAQLHPDVPALSERLYQALTASGSDSPKVELSVEDYARYRRSLAVVESRGLIRGTHSLNRRYVGGLWFSDPTYLLYLHALFGDSEAMGSLQEAVETLPPGGRLNGRPLSQETGIPLPFIDALFKVYEAQGYGICSKSIGVSHYIGK